MEKRPHTRAFRNYGADGETRTHTACATTPSRWRVYQFHHVGTLTTGKNYKQSHSICQERLISESLGLGLPASPAETMPAPTAQQWQHPSHCGKHRHDGSPDKSERGWSQRMLSPAQQSCDSGNSPTPTLQTGCLRRHHQTRHQDPHPYHAEPAPNQSLPHQPAHARSALGQKIFRSQEAPNFAAKRSSLADLYFNDKPSKIST